MSRAFFDAIKAGDLNETRRLLALDPALIHEKENGLSPVMVAAYHQEPETADFLAAGAGPLSIFETCATGRTDQVMRQLAREPQLVNAVADDGFQPLGLACFFGHHETAEILIQAGAEIDSPSQNPLKAAPIQSAAAAGHGRIVKILLDHGADPNVREQGGHTPLHAAAQNGDAGMIRALLDHGADLTLKNEAGRIPFDLANEAGHPAAAALLKAGIPRGSKKGE